jgi:hypothetical protein
MSKTVRIVMGTVDARCEENARIAITNVMNGRPFGDGRSPPLHIPDPCYPLGYMEIVVPDDFPAS